MDDQFGCDVKGCVRCMWHVEFHLRQFFLIYLSNSSTHFMLIAIETCTDSNEFQFSHHTRVRKKNGFRMIENVRAKYRNIKLIAMGK